MKIYSKKLILFSIVLLVLNFSVSCLQAQSTTGSIYGTVTDIDGHIIPEADVILQDVDTKLTNQVKTNRSGYFVFPAVDPGHYTVSIQAPGFATQTQTGIDLAVAQNINASFALTVGGISDVVTVTAQAPDIDTRESQLGETIESKKIEDLPLNGRNGYDLVQTVPGVTNYSPAAQGGDQNGTTFSVNGNRPNADTFYLDGAFNMAVYRNGGNLIPNPDALQEFRLLTSNFDAEFGRGPGGVVNVITRSGTNEVHGSVWEYLRNSAINSKPYFSTTGVTPLRQNQFGFTLGGPIRHDKAFLFGSYEGLRVRTPLVIYPSQILFPTEAEKHGNFSADPVKQQPTKGCLSSPGVICPGSLDPVAQNVMALVPTATIVGGARVEPQLSAPANVNSNQYLVRADYQLTSSHRLAGTFFTSRANVMNPNAGQNQIFNYSGVNDYENQTNAIAGDTWTISPNALNSLRVFYTLNHFTITNQHTGNTWAALGSHAADGGPLVTQPLFSITGYWSMGVGGSGPDNLYQQSFGFLDTFNYSHGNHTIKAGGSFLWLTYREIGGFLGSGKLAFSGGSTGNALADFLEGHSSSFSQNSGVNHRLHAPDPAVFIQDDWHLTNRLTLNLGLRWELYVPFGGQNNLGTFVPKVQSTRFPAAPLGLLAEGDPGIAQGIRPKNWKTFAPRFGFAMDVFGNGQTSLRGAYGIFYSSSQETLTGNLEQQPFLLSETITTNGLVNPYAPAIDPFPYNLSKPTFLSGATISGLAPGDAVPYVQEFNLNLQQQLSSKWSAQLAYVGSLSRKFYLLRDQNAPVYSPSGSATTASINARRLYEPTPSIYTFAQISEIDPISNASYHSLQATFRHQLSHNFSMLASYVWSRQIDYASTDPSNATALSLVDEYDISKDHGVSGTDIPNRFVASFVWQSPEVHRRGAFGREGLSGWHLNGIVTLSSGNPFTITSGVDTNVDGVATDRPNQVSNPNLSGGRSHADRVAEAFNVNAFAQLPAGVPYGNVGKNTLYGPGYANTDASAFKDFSLWHTHMLQFRAEAFNLFNHTNLGNPNGVLKNAKFGTISSAGLPRILQFALRYGF